MSQVYFSFVCFASRVIPGVLSWVLTLELSNIMFLKDLEIVVITLCFFFCSDLGLYGL